MNMVVRKQGLTPPPPQSPPPPRKSAPKTHDKNVGIPPTPRFLKTILFPPRLCAYGGDQALEMLEGV